MNLIDVDFEKRIYGLDILRAVAIIFVVYAHGMVILSPYIRLYLQKKVILVREIK